MYREALENWSRTHGTVPQVQRNVEQRRAA
jgi:hypothetical protein